MTGLTSLHLSDISDFVNGDPDSDPDSDQEDDPFFAMQQRLGECKALRALSLERCSLPLVPDLALPGLTGIVHLSLRGNGDMLGESGPDALDVLSQLTRLESLDLGGTFQDMEVPDVIRRLTSSLTKLVLDANDPSEFDPEILAGLTSLRDLSLVDLLANPLAGHELATLTNLTHLDISLGATAFSIIDETDTFTIPASFSSLVALEELDIDLQQVADGWDNLRPLQRLRVLSARCCFFPAVPPALGALTALEWACLHGAQDESQRGPRDGWEHLLALPSLVALSTDARPPRALRKAVRARRDGCGAVYWGDCADDIQFYILFDTVIGNERRCMLQC